MNDRILQALKALKTNQDKLQKNVGEIGKKVKQIEGYNEDRMRQLVARLSRDLERYEIIDGEWCYDGKPIGIKAEGIDGEIGPQGAEGRPGKDGKDGKPGKDGKDGKPGKDGKNGLPGKDGKDGKDGKNGLPGKDGETPNLKIGKVEDSPEAGGANAKIRKGKDGVLYLDLTLPRGPQGFQGFDATINGKSTIELIEGDNIRLSQNGKKLTISSTGGDSIPEESLKEFVKFTDYAGSNIDNIGVVYTNSNFGTRAGANGRLEVYPASESDIDNKTHKYRPITPSTLDYAIKSGIVDNKLEWTDEEKTSARTLLGIDELIGDIESLLSEV